LSYPGKWNSALEAIKARGWLLEAFDGKPRVIANARYGEIGGQDLFTDISAWPTGRALHATKSRRVAGMGRLIRSR
jgi:hypothetical protein